MKHGYFYLCIFIASSSCFLCLCQATLDGFKVLQLKLCIDDFLVANGVDCTIYVGDIIVFKTSQNMDNRIRFTNISKEFITKTLTL